ncbi:MAG: putative nitrogen fixation protein NifT [Sulfuricella sp.]|nr:putative nitrogen fixation protein NifT [Sulfuricella sp.]
MKIMLRKAANNGYTVYVAKKDLEENVVEMEKPELWGGTIKLGNGWVFALPEMPADTRLPLTVEARRLSGGDD